MINALRWGILGTGNITRQFAAGVLASTRGRLQAVASRAEASAKSFAVAFSIPSSHASYDSLLADPQVDVIYIALPNSMHHEWTLKALRAGKHVLCEKPIAANLSQAQEMFDVAQQTGRVLIEAFMYRSHPQTRAIIQEIRNNVIGPIQLIRTSFCYRTTRINDNIRFNAELAGGALMDIGCYCIDFSRLFAGEEPSAVHAIAHLHPTGIDDLAAGTLQFPSGILASFTCGMTTAADNSAFLCGTTGYLQIPVPWKPPTHQATYTLSTGTPPKMDNPSTPTAPAPSPTQSHSIDAARDLYSFEVDDFAATVQNAAPPAITPQDSLANMRILDELRRQVGVKF